MIIDDLYVAWPIVGPSEADAPLRVYANAVLSGAVAAQGLKPVARQCREIAERFSAVQHDQSSGRLIGEPVKRCDALSLEEAPRPSILEAAYHARLL